MPQAIRTRPFHAMAKPSGSDCNLRCAYCFYLEKSALYAQTERPRMSEAVLEAYVRDYIASIREEDEVAFTWQGGEPTLLGLDFYRRAARLQMKYGRGRRISNSFQTNGLLLDDAWCAFLAEYNFLVGLSLDGPADIHNEYRLTAGGGATHAKVMAALNRMQAHGVGYNILSCVNARSSKEPLRVYEFLRETGARFIQFLPVVERLAGEQAAALGLKLHGPGPGDSPAAVTPWSVTPEAYGRFLTDIFDCWVHRDVGQIFVMNFEWALANFMGKPGAVCHHRPTCGRSVAVEHNGDVYACDHYVYPEYRLGNILEKPFAAMLDSPAQERFGEDKFALLSKQCRECAVLAGCYGGCPKLRFVSGGGAEPPINYLCPGYHHFFSHTAPWLKAMSSLIADGRPVSEIMGVSLIYKDKQL